GRRADRPGDLAAGAKLSGDDRQRLGDRQRRRADQPRRRRARGEWIGGDDRRGRRRLNIGRRLRARGGDVGDGGRVERRGGERQVLVAEDREDGMRAGRHEQRGGDAHEQRLAAAEQAAERAQGTAALVLVRVGVLRFGGRLSGATGGG